MDHTPSSLCIQTRRVWRRTTLQLVCLLTSVCVCVCGCQCVEPGCVDCVYTYHREGPCHETQLHVLSFCLCRRVHRPSRGLVSPRHSYTCCRSACVRIYVYRKLPELMNEKWIEVCIIVSTRHRHLTFPRMCCHWYCHSISLSQVCTAARWFRQKTKHGWFELGSCMCYDEVWTWKNKNKINKVVADIVSQITEVSKSATSSHWHLQHQFQNPDHVLFCGIRLLFT